MCVIPKLLRLRQVEIYRIMLLCCVVACDRYLNETGSIVKFGDDYQANDDCHYTIDLDTCMFISMTFDLGDDEDCGEYIEVSKRHVL